MLHAGYTLRKPLSISVNVGTRQQLKPPSKAYLKIGFILLAISFFLSLYLVTYTYEVFKNYGINYFLNENELIYYNITDVPSDYVLEVNYEVNANNVSEMNVYFIFFDKDNMSFKLEKLNFMDNFSTGKITVSSHLSKIVLAFNSTCQRKVILDVKMKFQLKPSFFNVLSFACLVMSVIGVALSSMGLAYFLSDQIKVSRKIRFKRKP